MTTNFLVLRTDGSGMEPVPYDPPSGAGAGRAHSAYVLDTLYRLIGCDCVDRVAVTPGIDAWVDDEGMIKDEPEINPVATVFLGRPIFGVVVFAAHDTEGNVLGLDDATLNRLTNSIVVSVASYLAMTDN